MLLNEAIRVEARKGPTIINSSEFTITQINSLLGDLHVPHCPEDLDAHAGMNSMQSQTAVSVRSHHVVLFTWDQALNLALEVSADSVQPVALEIIVNDFPIPPEHREYVKN